MFDVSANEKEVEYKKTPIGTIPQDWSIDKLGNYVTIYSGDSPSKLKFSNDGFPYYKVDDLNDTEKYMGEGKLKVSYKSIRKLVPEKSLIFPKRGASILTNKVRILSKDSYFDTNIMGVEVNHNEIDYEFLYYYITKIGLYKIADTSTIPQLNNKHILPLLFPKPVLKEQQKIASILSTWDKAIELKEKLIEQKKEQKKGLMQKLLTGEVRLPGFEGEWREVKLGRIGKTYNGLTGKTAKDFGEGKPYIPYKTIFDHSKIDLQKTDYVMINKDEKQNCARNGDIFFTTSSETPNEVGMSSVLLDDVDEIYLNSFSFGYRLNDFSVLLPEFAQHYFRSNDFRKKMYILAQGSTRFNISKNEVMKIIIKIPGLREQKSISKVLTESDKELRLLINELSSLKHQKQGLMQQLLTGKVRVKV